MAAEAARPAPPGQAGVTVPPGPSEMRRALGLFASGVTIITGLDDGQPVGFACQAG